MKTAIRIAFALLLAAGIFFWAYFYVDFFCPATRCVITADKTEVVISRLSTPLELENIKARLLEKGIVMNVEKLVYKDDIQSIHVKVTSSHGMEGSFWTDNMRFTRYFSIAMDNSSKPVKFQIGVSTLLTYSE